MFSTIFMLFAVSVISLAVVRSRDSLLESARRYVSLRTQAIANLTRGPLLNRNEVDLYRVIEEQMSKQPDLLWVGVLDGEGRHVVSSNVPERLATVLAPLLEPSPLLSGEGDTPNLREHTVRLESEELWILDASSPILISKDQHWGGVRTLVSLQAVKEHVGRTALILAIASLTILLLGCGFIFLVSLRISTPIEALARSTRRIASGQFEGVSILEQGGEIGLLSRSFHEMAVRLHQMRSALEVRARESEARRIELDSVLGSFLDGVMAINEDGTLRFVNGMARRLLSLNSDDVIGSPMVSVVPYGQVCDLVSQAMDSSSRTVDQEMELSDSPDSKLTVRVRISPNGSRDEGIESGVVVVVQDVTDLRMAQKSQKRLLTNVSHELRTPISVLKLAATNLRRYPEMAHDRRAGILETIDRESTRLQRMIEDLLDISRLEVKGLRIQRRETDLQDIVSDVLSTVVNGAEEAGLRVRHRHPQSPVPGFVDPGRMFQVVTNLVRNSVHFTRQGGTVAAWVCRRDNGHRGEPAVGNPARGPVTHIRVFDSGLGMEPSELSKIFDRFYRIENEVHTIEGTGVGLAIVKEIVLKHDGAIFVTSVPGKGTLFTIELPTISSPAPDDQRDGSAGEGASGASVLA
jgi:two-component system sensor histidine kinase NblS